ncbi:MAG: helix-turn-helix transcriptional regulator [Dysgonomonas sp.]
MSINERIDLIIKELFSGNKRAFSRTVGISTSVTENIVGKRKSNPSFEVMEKIANSIQELNGEWLLTGKEPMLKTETTQYNSNISIASEDNILYGSPDIARPFLDIAENNINLANGFTSAIIEADSKNMSIPFVRDYDFSLRLHGDSMVNNDNPKRSIEDGDIVACRFWKESYICWGEVYALATTNGYIIKKIIPSDIPNHIKCVSFNEKNSYLPYDLPLSHVSEWAIVVGKVSIVIW